MRILALTTLLFFFQTTIVNAMPPVVRHVSTAGTVWINAAALPSGSFVYDGDTVATAKNGFAMVTGAEQARFDVRQDSLVRIGPQQITLEGGAIASQGVPVRVGPFTVKPMEQPGSRPWFVVADRDGRRLVAAHNGDALIDEEGSEPVVVPEGYYALPVSDSPPEQSPGEAPWSRGIPDQRGAKRWLIFSLTAPEGIAILVALGATAVGATFAGMALGDDDPISPSR